ncbi:MAG TPA: hypothetical protein VGI60_14790 [Chthoniobacterales bacterium]|jgi:hypothetical protein
MNTPLTSNRTLLESDIDRLYQRLYSVQKRGLRYSLIRRGLAYLLKATVVLGSVAVASQRFPEYDQVFGIATLAAYGADSVTSNLKRLVAMVEAGYAAKANALSVSSSYNRELGVSIEQLNQKTITQQEFDAKKLLLQNSTHTTLEGALKEIEQRIAANDVEALRQLKIEAEAKQQ